MTAADQDQFKAAFTAVMMTYPNVQVGPDMVRAYWLALKPRLDIEEFEEACSRLMVDDREFPPRPRDFIDSVEGDLSVEAHRWWKMLTDFSRQGPYRYVARTESYALTDPIPDRARFALESVGGSGRLARASDRDMDFIRQRFETAYTTAANHEIERPDQPLLPRRQGGMTVIGNVIAGALPKGAE